MSRRATFKTEPSIHYPQGLSETDHATINLQISQDGGHQQLEISEEDLKSERGEYFRSGLSFEAMQKVLHRRFGQGISLAEYQSILKRQHWPSMHD